MTQLRTLKQLVQVLFALCIFTMFFTVPFILISIVMPESIPFKINGEMAKDIPTVSKIVTLVVIGGIACFIYALYTFKQNLALFEKKRVFDIAVVTNFRKMGRIIYLGSILVTVGSVAYRITRGEVSIDLGFILEIVFIFAMGLFFEVLAGVFEWAKKLKEENDLTV